MLAEPGSSGLGLRTTSFQNVQRMQAACHRGQEGMEVERGARSDDLAGPLLP